MYPVLFRIGSLTIYTYGFFIFLGVLAGYIFSLSQCKKYGLSEDKISDLLFWSLLLGFVFSRIFYIALNWNLFLIKPLSFIFSGSGFIFYGGLSGGVIAAFFFIKKNQLPLFKTLDLVSPALALGHSLGRVGCFFYGCCYGRPTSSLIGVVFPRDCPAGLLGGALIPTQLISSLALLVIFGLLLLIRDKKSFPGQVFLSYLGLYSAFRFIIEFYRADPRGGFFFFSTSQWLALLFLVLVLLFWPRFSKKIN